ncbi:MAG: PQQ-dependent sugar dehydrogenase [Acidimicrobiia bacterium]|nr:PQQ-dependent sugar dehydrogenase [Acidimicrobiia bacterium]
MSKPIFSETKSHKPYYIIAFIFVVIGAIYFLVFQNDTSNVQKSTESRIVSSNVPTLKTETIVGGLVNVWDIGFLPNGTMLYTERPGRLSAFKDGKSRVIQKVSKVFAEGEGGLLGLAIDTKYSENSNIFVCYDGKVGDKLNVKVKRIKLDYELKVVEDKDIITDIPANESGRHSGCRIRMDNEEHLWVGAGDTASSGISQNHKSLGGKMLRVDRDGKGVEGNMGGDFDPRIFNFGHRNLQGIALFNKPIDGVYGYSAEHGTDVDDEINLLIKGNFGWDPGPGYDENVPMTDLKKYPDAKKAIWSSGDSTIAVSGATLIEGEQWGSYNGALAVAVLKDQKLNIYSIDKGYKVTNLDSILKDFGRLRSVIQGPDGNLFITTDNNKNDKIIKIIPKL